ncbi:MAG: alkaline phosphatase D family protein [bacterium]
MKTSRQWMTVIVAVLLYLDAGHAQKSYLQSGPMVGYGDMREVLLWVQTKKSAKVKIEYFDRNEPQKRSATAELETTKATAFTAKLIADRVQPGKHYEYELFINGIKVELPYPLRFQTQKLWQWRTDPPDFKMALGSCAYVNDPPYDRPGDPYGKHSRIFTEITKKHPDLMLWLGDNVYLREPDWNTRTGILYRYTHTRSLPELQPLLASVHHYAIWDDHDFGPNNSDRGFGMKPETLRAFELFWGNPFFGVDGQPGITCTFEWSDMQFFLLDNRYYRSPNNRKTGTRGILGKRQLDWLIDALVSSKAPFKFVAIGGQVLNPFAGSENHAAFAQEREAMLKAIEQENISGVIFLTGDRHRTELTKLQRPSAYPLYDVTISPLTAGPFIGGEKEPNFLRVPGTVLTERNFGIFEFSGPRKNRHLKITVFDKDGKEKWTYTIHANDLK